MEVYVSLMVGVAGEKVFDNYILLTKSENSHHLPYKKAVQGKTLTETAKELLAQITYLDPSWETNQPRQVGIYENGNDLYICYSLIIPEKVKVCFTVDWVRIKDIFTLDVEQSSLEQIKLILLRRL